MPRTIKAPWTPQQVEALNRFQQYGFVHEFTCPNGHGALIATQDGWFCQHCNHVQEWAHAMMAEPWIGPKEWKCWKCGHEVEPAPTHIGICPECGLSTV